jgi:hypothetical protein
MKEVLRMRSRKPCTPSARLRSGLGAELTTTAMLIPAPINQ